MKYALLILGVLSCIKVSAQDNNYWNQMPGTALMGGAVVGGIRSNSAVYYNPGALSFIDSNTISVSAASYQMEYATIKNGGGPGVDLLSDQFQAIPLVAVSGIYKTKKTSRSTFGYMLFTKNQTSNNFSYRYDGDRNNGIFNNDPHKLGFDNYRDSTNGPVEYIGDYNLQTSMTELCFGFGYSYKLSEHAAIGLTPIVAYRTQTYSSSFVARAFPDSSSNLYNNYQVNNGVGINSIGFNDVENLSFYNVRMYFKCAVALDFGNLKLGANITTPSINLGGFAYIARDIYYSGGFADSASYLSNIHPFSYALNDRQGDLQSYFKSPFSVSVGIDYALRTTNLCITAEYFAPIAPYNAATPDSSGFLQPVWQNKSLIQNGLSAINSANYLELRESARSVTNVAIAVKQKVTENIYALVSFRTDYTAYQKVANDFWEYRYVDTLHQPGQKLSFSDINLYHINVGMIKKNKKSDLHLGVTYTFGTNNNFQPLANIANPLDNTNALGAIPNYKQTATYRYDSYSLVLGYTYHIR